MPLYFKQAIGREVALTRWYFSPFDSITSEKIYLEILRGNKVLLKNAKFLTLTYFVCNNRGDVNFCQSKAVFLGSQIDLSLLLSHWKPCLAVSVISCRIRAFSVCHFLIGFRLARTVWKKEKKNPHSPKQPNNPLTNIWWK